MDFAEALERFGTTDPAELPDNIKLSQKKRFQVEPGRNKKRKPARTAKRD
jgi:hypothetical protein